MAQNVRAFEKSTAKKSKVEVMDYDSKVLRLSLLQTCEQLTLGNLRKKAGGVLGHKWFTDRFALLKKEDVIVASGVCRIATAAAADEILERIWTDFCKVQYEKFNAYHVFIPWLDMISPAFLDHELDKSEQLIDWDETTPKMRLLPFEDGEDEQQYLQQFADMVINATTSDLVKQAENVNAKRFLIAYCTSTLQAWAVGKPNRTKWFEQTPNHIKAHIETVLDGLRGILRLACHRPGKCGARPSHVDFVMPLKVAKGTLTFADLNGASRVMAAHMARSEIWQAYRAEAEGAKNTDDSNTAAYDLTFNTLNDMVDSGSAGVPEHMHAMGEAIEKMIEFKQAGLRADANEEILDIFMKMVEKDVEQFTLWSSEGKADMVNNQLPQYQRLVADCPSSRIEKPLATLTALLASCHLVNVKSALGSALDASFTKEADIKTLHQTLASAAKTPVDKTNVAKMALARPKVWNALTKLLVQDGHFTEARVASHRDIFERFHQEPLFVTYIGGKTNDAWNQAVLHQVPNVVAELRVALQEQEKVQTVPGHWKDHLDTIMKVSSKWANVHARFMDDERRAKISEAFLPGLDQVLEFTNNIDANAGALIQDDLGRMAMKELESDLDLKTLELGRLSRGHPSIPDAHWHKDVKMADLKKLAVVAKEFSDTLEKAEITSTLDAVFKELTTVLHHVVVI